MINGIHESLETELSAADADSSLVARGVGWEWVRTRIGIIGAVEVPEGESAAAFGESVSSLISAAHFGLDSLPQSIFSLNDVWNLLLLLRLPWTRDQFHKLTDVVTYAAILDDILGSLRGSRKLALFKDESAAKLLGPTVGSAASADLDASPLRDELHRLARDVVEEEALSLIFAKRLTDADFERLIEALTLRRKDDPKPSS